jgi:threonine/homoserine/homoserine lactone efflux protein
MPTFPWHLIIASVPFLASMGFTPGPNNILVASSGVNFGFRATIPHIFGITFGFPAMLLAVGLGLTRIFIAIPAVHVWFKAVSIVYLVYLAWRIATAAEVGSTGGTARPLTFLQAAAFQWVNVKAWIIALSAVTTYTVVNASLTLQISAIAAIDLVITLASVSSWTLFGHFLRSYLHSPLRRRWFNWGMAALLIASIIPAFWE